MQIPRWPTSRTPLLLLLQPIRTCHNCLDPKNHRRACSTPPQSEVGRHHGRCTNHSPREENQCRHEIGGVGADERPEAKSEADQGADHPQAHVDKEMDQDLCLCV